MSYELKNISILAKISILSNNATFAGSKTERIRVTGELYECKYD